jgi:hypothetical protein
MVVVAPPPHPAGPRVIVLRSRAAGLRAARGHVKLSDRQAAPTSLLMSGRRRMMEVLRAGRRDRRVPVPGDEDVAIVRPLRALEIIQKGGSKVAIPGFTAESSMLTMSANYNNTNLRTAQNPGFAKGQVVPAMPCCSSCAWYCSLHPNSSLCGRCWGFCSPRC